MKYENKKLKEYIKVLKDLLNNDNLTLNQNQE